MAKEIVAVVKDGGYDLIIAGRESIDYNGGMVPGMIAALIDASYVNNCVGLELVVRLLQFVKLTEVKKQ